VFLPRKQKTPEIVCYYSPVSLNMGFKPAGAKFEFYFKRHSNPSVRPKADDRSMTEADKLRDDNARCSGVGTRLSVI
jgi:hypothetical protein